MVKDSEACVLQSKRLQKVRHNWVADQQQLLLQSLSLCLRVSALQAGDAVSFHTLLIIEAFFSLHSPAPPEGAGITKRQGSRDAPLRNGGLCDRRKEAIALIKLRSLWLLEGDWVRIAGSFLLRHKVNMVFWWESVLKSDVSLVGTLHNEAARSNPPSDVRALRRMAKENSGFSLKVLSDKCLFWHQKPQSFRYWFLSWNAHHNDIAEPYLE